MRPQEINAAANMIANAAVRAGQISIVESSDVDKKVFTDNVFKLAVMMVQKGDDVAKELNLSDAPIMPVGGGVLMTGASLLAQLGSPPTKPPDTKPSTN
jgi:hypothetical protein